MMRVFRELQIQLRKIETSRLSLQTLLNIHQPLGFHNIIKPRKERTHKVFKKQRFQSRKTIPPFVPFLIFEDGLFERFLGYHVLLGGLTEI